MFRGFVRADSILQLLLTIYIYLCRINISFFIFPDNSSCEKE